MIKKLKDLHKNGKIEINTRYDIDRNNYSLIYTPHVAEISQIIAKNKDEAYKYSQKSNLIAIVSDGSAVLGLGNIGPSAAIPVMEGKAALFKKFGRVNAFPVLLDTNDTLEIVRTIKIISPYFGGINLEDISAPRCFEIEDMLKKMLDIPVFHDDQHATAIVALAGLINSLKLSGKKIETAKIVISGAGASGIATAKLLLSNGAKNIIMVDSKGIIYEGRRENMNSYKKEMSKKTNRQKIKGKLSNALHKADVFIGLSQGNILCREDIRIMNDKPVVFALANPVPEIMPSEAKKAGAFITATGRGDFENQINNVIAFPGFFRGLLESRRVVIDDGLKLAAAKAIAATVKAPNPHRIIPSVFDKSVHNNVARAVRTFRK